MDNPAPSEKINVFLNISLPKLSCDGEFPIDIHNYVCAITAPALSWIGLLRSSSIDNGAEFVCLSVCFDMLSCATHTKSLTTRRYSTFDNNPTTMSEREIRSNSPSRVSLKFSIVLLRLWVFHPRPSWLVVMRALRRFAFDRIPLVDDWGFFGDGALRGRKLLQGDEFLETDPLKNFFFWLHFNVF